MDIMGFLNSLQALKNFFLFLLFSPVEWKHSQKCVGHQPINRIRKKAKREEKAFFVTWAAFKMPEIISPTGFSLCKQNHFFKDFSCVSIFYQFSLWESTWSGFWVCWQKNQFLQLREKHSQLLGSVRACLPTRHSRMCCTRLVNRHLTLN